MASDYVMKDIDWSNGPTLSNLKDAFLNVDNVLDEGNGWINALSYMIPGFGFARGITDIVDNINEDTVSLLDILYIGQGKNVNERIDTHDKREVFLKKCDEDKNETLCYSIAEVNETDLNLIENALIFAQQPELNNYYKDNFSFEKSEFHLEGKCSLMKHVNFSIK